MLAQGPYLVITPLGGLGEIGLNCQLWETAAGVVMVDCGLMFPDDDQLGVDLLIPHFGAVSAIKEKLLGIVLTHGHEDHIGALPWILPELKGAKIYGSRFTLALVEHKLREHDLLSTVELCPVKARASIELGELRFHFFPVCHSIPDGFGLGVETPAGRVVLSGDFKIDLDQQIIQNDARLRETHQLPLTPAAMLADFRDFAGPDGARLLLSDSTNILRQGHSLSEREVKESLGRVFAKAKGRIVVTLFSSHIQRIQEVFDLARDFGRSVVISGKSLANNIDIAASLGLAMLPPDFYNAHNGVPEIPDDKTVLIVTGAQGEPLSALSRMIWGRHRQLSIRAGDTVVMSSRVIPGNARAISRMINEMYRLGAEVLYESSDHVHASGHAYREELREMLLAVRPEIFVPVHGEYQHLVQHGRLAEACGVAPEFVVLLEDGQSLRIFPRGTEPRDFVLGPKMDVESTLVDGKGVGDVGASVLRERRILGEEGLVVVSMTLDAASGAVLSGPEIISRGFVFEATYSHLLEDAKCLVLEELEKISPPIRISRLAEAIRVALRRFFRSVLERDPLVVSVINEI